MPSVTAPVESARANLATISSMDQTFLDTLRCPVDPNREGTLARDKDQLVCQCCEVRFPVKQGLPVLIPAEAILPDGCRGVEQLPCRVRNRRMKS